MIKYIPIETELKLPHYLEQDKWIGKKVRIKKHFIKDTILRRSTTAIIRKIIFNRDGTWFAIKVQYADGTEWNESPEEFKLKVVSLIQ
ncbi:MAG: hypothetical protein Q8J68_07970 [Methanolobus sp.]|uniref:hypothetical protein n=1 Tax=Methanolobus sp. TaxID=1874737 RepID=UPI00272F5C5F|nr:hypothetical protein [Methanolobus sp.]MDP2217205.1 hypothetical protein [Methanolobus sp.]